MLRNSRFVTAMMWRVGCVALATLLLGLAAASRPFFAEGATPGIAISALAAASGGSSSTVARKPGTGDAVNSFNEAVYKYYTGVNNGQPLESYRRMLEVERRFLALPPGIVATSEGAQALAKAVDDAKRAATAVRIDKGKIAVTAAVLRLTADALVNADKPVWHRYRTVIGEHLRELSAALAKSGATSEARAVFLVLADQYELIRSAALMRSDPAVVERADSAIRYAQHVLSADKPDARLLQGLMPALETALTDLFPPEDEEPAFGVPAPGPSWGSTALMGAFIVTMLTWVGWRRYRTETTAATPRGTLRPKRRGRRR